MIHRSFKSNWIAQWLLGGLYYFARKPFDSLKDLVERPVIFEADNLHQNNLLALN